MKNILYLLILTIFAIISCSDSTRTIDSVNVETTDSVDVRIIDSVSIGKHKFEIIEKNNQAFLKNGELEELLKLKPPCYFLRLDGNIQTYSYPDVKVDAVVIIVGNIISDEQKKFFGADLDKVCGMKKQGLLIKDVGPQLTEKMLSGGICCKDYGLDEKDFSYFAH